MKIDFTYLETLSDGDPDFIKEFISTFESTADSLTKKMFEQLDSGDISGLGKTAHQLKPSAKMLGLIAGEKLEELQDNPQMANQEILSTIQEECMQALDKTKGWAKEQGVDV